MIGINNLFGRILASSKDVLDISWSIARFMGHLIGYWIAIGGGLSVLYFVYRWRREHKIRSLLEENRIENIQKISLSKKNKETSHNFEGLFLSRYEKQDQIDLNNIGIFVIPHRRERAEIALLRYLPVLQGINGDIFVLNKPSLSQKNLKKNLDDFQEIVESYNYFQLKTGLINEDNLYILANVKNTRLALALSTQVHTKGIIIDFTRKGRSYRRWKGLTGRVRSLSLVNIVAMFFEKTKALPRNGNTPLESFPTLVFVTLKDGRTKRTNSNQYRINNVREDMLKIAIRIKELDYTEEFREAILSLHNENKLKKAIYVNN
ncbi:MAG: hypothetical protein V3V41_04825 [Candidatus Heimdallarchaeota archaeon]